MDSIWDNIFSYYGMKNEIEEYTYDTYDLQSPKTDTEDDIYMNYTISIIDRVKYEVIQKGVGIYFDILTLYCAFETRWLEIVKNNEIAYAMHCILKYFGRIWQQITCNYLLEPDSKIWIDNVSIYRVKQENGRFEYNINDSYAYNAHIVCEYPQFISEMKRCLDKNATRVVGYPDNKIPVGVIDVIGHVVIGKYTTNNDHSYYVVSTKNIPETIQKSSAGFMSIEYTHPGMEERIPIDLPHEMFVSGNILFTNAFVLRALCHQPKPFLFDMDYKLKIVDGMVNMIDITSNEYIVLRENGYDVKKID